MKKVRFIIGKAFLLLFIYGLCSCNNHQDNTAILRQIDEGLVQSNRQIRMRTAEVLESLKNKTNDPRTTDKANIILPKALDICAQSDSLLRYFDGLKTQLQHDAITNKEAVRNLFEKENKAAEIYSKLHYYKQRVLLAHEQLIEVVSSFVLTSKELDSTKNTDDKLEQMLAHASYNEAIAFLSRLQNNVAICENMAANFLSLQIPSYSDNFYDSYSVILGQNTKILLAGDDLEIMAGVGAFSAKALPTIIVNKDTVKINERGVAIHKIKTSKTAGNYIIPVTLKFTDQYGIKQDHTFTVEYKTISGNLK